MKLKVNKFLVTAALFLLLPIVTMAQLRVGYMNPQKVMNALPQKAQITKELSNYAAQKEKLFAKRTTALRNEIVAYQKKAASMSSEENNKEKARLDTLSQKLSQYKSELEQDISNKRSELLSPLMAKVNKAIKSVALQMHLDFVLNKATGQGDSILMYVSSEGKQKYDITQKVIDKLTNK